MSEKYAFADAEFATLAGEEACAPTVTQMCEWLGVSKSGYYDWRSRPQSAAAKRRELLKIKIRALFEVNNEEYGYRRMHAALVRGGEQCSPELVRSRHARAGTRALPAEAVAALADRAGRPGRADPGSRQPRLHRGKAGPEDGRAILLISGPGKGGFTSRRSSTARPVRSSAGRWTTITRRRSSQDAIRMAARNVDLPEGCRVPQRPRKQLHLRRVREGTERAEDTPVRGPHRDML